MFEFVIYECIANSDILITKQCKDQSITEPIRAYTTTVRKNPKILTIIQLIMAAKIVSNPLMNMEV
jgi:ABC-type arginine transport system permease subunit